MSSDLEAIDAWLKQLNPLCYYSTLTVDVDVTVGDDVGSLVERQEARLKQFCTLTEGLAKLATSRGLDGLSLLQFSCGAWIDGATGSLAGVSPKQANTCEAIVRDLRNQLGIDRGGCPVVVHEHLTAPQVEYPLGTFYQVEPAGADLCKALRDAYPLPIGLTSVDCPKPKRVIAKLPQPIQSIIETDSRGSRFTV